MGDSLARACGGVELPDTEYLIYYSQPTYRALLDATLQRQSHSYIRVIGAAAAELISGRATLPEQLGLVQRGEAGISIDYYAGNKNV